MLELPWVLGQADHLPAKFIAVRVDPTTQRADAYGPKPLKVRLLDDLHADTKGSDPDGKATPSEFVEALIWALYQVATEADPVGLYVGGRKIWDSIRGKVPE